jgi:uncharacterized coiled-coil DUF342 family protein
MRYKNIVASGLLAASLGLSFTAGANESAGEKATAETNKSVDSAKETYRNAKNEICELVNGKMHCAAKKMKSKMRTAADKTKTKAKEVKNKVD